MYSAVPHRYTPILGGDEDSSVYSDYLNRNEEMTGTDYVRLRNSLAESQLGSAYSPGQRESPWPSLYPGQSLANVKFGSRLVSANSVFSGSRPPSCPTVTTPSLRSVMSDDSEMRGRSGHSPD